MRTVHLHRAHIFLGVLFSGGFAVLFALAALRRQQDDQTMLVVRCLI
jgi:hypothetical protein